MGAIFTLHHVTPEPLGNFPPNGHLRVAPAFLEAVIRHLKARDVDFVDLAEVARRVEAQAEGRARGRFFAAFTLDDGYCNNAVHAAPIFRREEVPYTIFVTPGLSDGSVLPWWEMIEKVVRDNAAVVVPFAPGSLPCRTAAEKCGVFDQLSIYLRNRCAEGEVDVEVRRIAAANGIDVLDAGARVMDWDELRTLSQDPLCTIGAHSMTHPRLARLNEADLVYEMQRSREIIGDELGRRPDFFAYPYGYRNACGPREFAMAAHLGYRAAFTTRLHALTAKSSANIQALPRLSLNGYYQDPRYVDVLMSGLPGLWKERGTDPHYLG
ncbi:polysaccharide deacetylase [Aureimonas sp. SA4125]|uniref:polysaccharide deacetylase family protein n=1 Tax=Aureimonas sp. SA4125 TaxID=2826993 RepID=UPI001CC49BE8|nr:polysaccharide deacetylase family protein [Aureimonas sp. SA4125]BDA84088.1 polysaccharide deacetylase [Aureimonas sp. SA4125]